MPELYEYVTTAEASERTRYSARQIHKLCEIGRIRFKKQSKNKTLVNLNDVCQYANAHPVKVLDTVWDNINKDDGNAYYPLFGYDCKYFLTDKLKVIDCTNGRVLTPQPLKDSKGNELCYKRVFLLQNGETKGIYLHRLVGKILCPNALQKDIVHHIEPHNPSIDKPSNLIWVWKWQHDELHRLLRKNKITEYKNLVNKIKKENKQKLYKIPHLDFKPNENFEYWMWITDEGYKLYKSGKDVPLVHIIMETATRLIC